MRKKYKLCNIFDLISSVILFMLKGEISRKYRMMCKEFKVNIIEHHYSGSLLYLKMAQHFKISHFLFVDRKNYVIAFLCLNNLNKASALRT